MSVEPTDSGEPQRPRRLSTTIRFGLGLGCGALYGAILLVATTESQVALSNSYFAGKMQEYSIELPQEFNAAYTDNRSGLSRLQYRYLNRALFLFGTAGIPVGLSLYRSRLVLGVAAIPLFAATVLWVWGATTRYQSDVRPSVEVSVETIRMIKEEGRRPTHEELREMLLKREQPN